MVTTSFISRLSRAVDLIEQRSQQNRPWKVVTVRRGYKEDPDTAEARHYARVTILALAGHPAEPPREEP